MPGCWAICAIPPIARTVNQTPITGPNRRPTAPVPNRWIRNSAARIASAIGTTTDSNDGETTSRPSTEERTEIAGVIIPSP